MTAKADRPPSERTPERELADRIDELTRELRNAERRSGGSWWDQLPAEMAGIFAHTGGHFNEFNLYTATQADLRLTAQMHPNCLDLGLRAYGHQIMWQRRLFVGPPASP